MKTLKDKEKKQTGIDILGVPFKISYGFKYKDVKESVLDYYNLSKNWRKDNNTLKLLFKKYNFNENMSLQNCYLIIFGDFEE